MKVVELKNFTDSINYAFGVLNGDQMRMYILANDTDGSAQKDFIENLNKAMSSHAHNPQMVMMGKQIGNAIREQEPTGLLGMEGVATNFELIKLGFINGMYEYDSQMNAQEASTYIENTMNQIKYGDTKAEGEKFLEANKLKEGVITTESGLQYEVITMGKGKKPVATDRVKVHYHGTLIDGTVFDSSVDRGEPITFGLNQVIPGWTEGLQLMPVGSKFRFYIPQELGYGAREAGSIPPYSTLIFEVELLGIEK
ncbi:MAG: FKBP-type peptidyl-prolyl cis-trans isomerase [Paludibacteraceae bacterium]|nr:FKBP-type peptidyl-prolyl cis-trans isomerase [Bacteroidales bacterium]MDY4148884.1 FKBP-type peptidyl-prolyl cis-trans isomerase [Paludibacteraceae bacterium]